MSEALYTTRSMVTKVDGIHRRATLVAPKSRNQAASALSGFRRGVHYV